MPRRITLLITVLVIAASGLVYELVAATVASYMLGDSVTQFSITIGVYLFSMGLGSYASKHVRRASLRFVEAQLAVALVGGFSAPLMFRSFALAGLFPVVLYGLIVVIGALVGLQIPLLLRILKEELALPDLLANVLGVDYLGALAASWSFALVLVPGLGLTRTSLVFGLVNCSLGVLATWVLGGQLGARARLRARAQGISIAALLVAGLARASALSAVME